MSSARVPASRYQSTVRVFENPFLEKFTRVHPIIPLLMWGPFSLFLMWRTLFVHELGVGALLGMGFLALVLWTLTEYLLHRFVFHFRAVTPFEKRIAFLIHGLHHDDPNDPMRLVMPPFPAVVLCVIFYSLFRAIFGPVWVEPFFAFFIVGYLGYDYIHYGIHHFPCRSAAAKLVKKHHMQHHFITPDARYGVSSPLWDHVFRTLAQPPAAQDRAGAYAGQGSAHAPHPQAQAQADAGLTYAEPSLAGEPATSPAYSPSP
jgi:sterol desaturase/sphingolipid hydroxylase (fatty acid hydroxylase superfamily)